MADADYLFKVLVLGDLSVGKSSIIRRFHEDKFDKQLCTTVGVDFFVHDLELNGKKVKLQLWDTAGQERYRTMTTSYFRDAHGALIVFDLTSKESFKALKEYWLREFYSRANGSEAIVIIVGNKSDLEEQREVHNEEIKEFCDLYSLSWIETSAKSSSNVTETFHSLAKKLVENYEETLSLPPSYYSGPGSFTLHGAYDVPEQAPSYWSYCGCSNN